MVLAKSYARLGWQNLVNFGILPLEFKDHADYDALEQGDILELKAVRESLENGKEIRVKNKSNGKTIECKHSLSDRQLEVILEGGVINYFKKNNL